MLIQRIADLSMIEKLSEMFIYSNRTINYHEYMNDIFINLPTFIN